MSEDFNCAHHKMALEGVTLSLRNGWQRRPVGAAAWMATDLVRMAPRSASIGATLYSDRAR